MRDIRDHTNTEGPEEAQSISQSESFYPTGPTVTTEPNVGPNDKRPPVIISLSPSVRQPSYDKVWKTQFPCYPLLFFVTAFFWGIGCALSSLVIIGCLCFALGVGYLLMEEV